MENTVNMGVRGYDQRGFDGIGPKNGPDVSSTVCILNPNFKRRWTG